MPRDRVALASVKSLIINNNPAFILDFTASHQVKLKYFPPLIFGNGILIRLLNQVNYLNPYPSK